MKRHQPPGDEAQLWLLETGEQLRIAQMLEQLACDDDVETFVREGERLVEIGPVRLDSGAGGLGKRLAVGVDSDNLVSACERPGQRAVPAAEIEHAAARPAD